MKRKSLLVLMLLALAMPMTIFAQETTCEDFTDADEVTSLYNAGTLPTGWDINYQGTGNYAVYAPKVYIGTDYAPSGYTGGKRVVIMAGTNNIGNDTYVILPARENISSMSFTAWKDNANGTLDVGYMTNKNDGSTFQSLLTSSLSIPVYSSANSTNMTFEVPVSSIPSNARLAFKWSWTSGYNLLFIDDVCVYTTEPTPEPTPTCDFFEDFESYTGSSYYEAGSSTDLSSYGWAVIYNGSADGFKSHVYYNSSNNSAFGPLNGSKYFGFVAGVSSNYGSPNYLVLPEHEGVPSHIAFLYKYEDGSQGTLTLGYTTGADESTFTTLYDVASGGSNAVQTYSRDITVPAGKRLAFRWTVTSGSHICSIDDICVTYEHNYIFTNGSGDGQWTTASNWSPSQMPTLSDEVTINAACTIPANTVAQANSITLDTNGSLTIADGGQLFCNSAVTATVQKTIAAHGNNTSTGWNFIASPISTSLTPSGLITDAYENNIPEGASATYDFYYYDEAAHYWRNYRNSTFTMNNGQGYLYANAAGTQIEFTGTLCASNADYTVNNLSYTSGNGNLAGFNLVGNPFACNASVDQPCYIIQNGVIVATEGTVAAPCSGVMVQASATVQSVTFTRTTDAAEFSTGRNQLNITIANKMTARGERSMIDNAIVSFNENSQLEKFYFGTPNANIYIPQGEKEFAIVSAEAQGEMPVCFKATKNGTYTITVSPEGVELNYLHLIDNMTGMDIDLLQTSSYTFDASTRDYESRFRLVFGAENNTANAETFAYYNGSEWQLNNEGEATLQVVDVMGRIVSTETINGCANVNVNAAHGIYMLRLINGENVKVQKVVVK